MQEKFQNKWIIIIIIKDLNGEKITVIITVVSVNRENVILKIDNVSPAIIVSWVETLNVPAPYSEVCKQ